MYVGDDVTVLQNIFIQLEYSNGRPTLIQPDVISAKTDRLMARDRRKITGKVLRRFLLFVQKHANCVKSSVGSNKEICEE